MNDISLELRKKWRAEFEQLCDFAATWMVKSVDGQYDKAEVESQWRGFLLARSNAATTQLSEDDDAASPAPTNELTVSYWFDVWCIDPTYSGGSILFNL